MADIGSATPTDETIRIVIVESRALVGVGIRGVLDAEPDMEVVAEVRSADAALAVAEDNAPDVFIVDIESPESSINAATRRLTQGSPGSGIVVVGREDNDASLIAAMEIGATGHVAAIAEPAELVAVIRKVADGDDPLKDQLIDRPDLIDRIMDGFRETFHGVEEPLPMPLTPRELAVLRHIAEGMRNREIGEFLDVNEQTVKNHVSSILHKLGVPNRTHAVTFAVRQGWFGLEEVAASAETRTAAHGPQPLRSAHGAHE